MNRFNHFAVLLNSITLISITTFAGTSASTTVRAEELPFQHTVEVYRSDDDEAIAFALRLEQPFLAEEFEKSNYLRLRSNHANAYLIYPKETKFQQKHAEFYGRLKGEGVVEVQLAYETVSENLDGSRRVQVREGTIKINIPEIPADRTSVGPRSLLQDWARKQNEHFARLLTYYPDETFFQYCLLQSKARYGIEPPPIPKRMLSQDNLEGGLYKLFTGSLAMQESLQRRALSTSVGRGDYSRHISTLAPPPIKSLDYEALLQTRLQEQQAQIQVPEISRLVPVDQYFLHFRSFAALAEVLDLASQWGDDLLRLKTLTAQDNRLQEKLQEQLGIDRSDLEALFAQRAVTEVAVTGSDPYLLDGTDVSLILRIKDNESVTKTLAGWIESARQRNPELVDRDFNYRGHQVTARYTIDRLVSSFTTRHDDLIVFSNSHRAIRQIIDASLGETACLHDAADFQYISTLLPPAATDQSGYYYASDAFIRRIISPSAKISQKRRVECFNNLVMQNNASLFFRLEYGRSPESLTEMIEKRFIAADKIVCPHGGAYSFDAASDTCTCSLHNRLRYLTPNAELTVLNISENEAAEYDRYKSRYQSFWQQVFDPVATRITVAPTIKFETCILPLAQGGLYEGLQRMVDQNPQLMNVAAIAPSAVASVVMVPGRDNTAQFLMAIPGVAEIVRQDPTLTDLQWLGDQVSLHFCDGEIIFEIDPTQWSSLNLPMIGEAPAVWQAMAGALFLTANLPVYATIDIESDEKAQRLLEQFSQTAFLRGGDLGTISSKIDSYRLPDYRDHAIYVLSTRLHAIALRFHLALVDGRLVIATKPEILRQVIDASSTLATNDPTLAHFMLRLNRQALDHLHDDVQLHWAEKSRLACHRNIISIYNFHQLYNAPMDQIAKLSEAKYGIRHFCPEGGEYAYDPDTSQIVCSVHGNRESSHQNPTLNPESSSAKFIDSIRQVIASLRYEEHAMVATIEVDRTP